MGKGVTYILLYLRSWVRQSHPKKTDLVLILLGIGDLESHPGKSLFEIVLFFKWKGKNDEKYNEELEEKNLRPIPIGHFHLAARRGAHFGSR